MGAEVKRSLVGGQAVIEGVMMRSGRSLAVAVRRPGGEVVVRKDRLHLVTDRIPLLKRPVLRGVPALYYSLLFGIRALNYSAAQAMEEEGEKGGGWLVTLTTILSLAAGTALFFYLPLLLSQGVATILPFVGSGLLFNTVDGLFRLAVFLVYVLLISRWKEIRRVFEYHGAEHMAVAAYEGGADLSVEAVRGHSTMHPRCGTSFLLIVMILSILLFSLIPGQWPLWGKFLSRVVLLPALAGLSYEVVRLGASRPGGGWAALISLPGLWLQRLTTRLPEDSQIEVALAALTAVLDMEGGRSGA